MGDNSRVKGKGVVRMEEALKLRVRGYSFRKIARVMGITHTYAHKLVVKALNESRDRTAILGDQLRELELRRLDDMYIKCFDILRNSGNDKNIMMASDRLLKIMERRAKLTGLDIVSESLLDDEDIDESYL